MRKFAITAAAVGLLTASCSGGNPSAFVPGVSAGHAKVRTAERVPPGWAATATQGVRPPSGTDLGRLRVDAIASRVLGPRPITVRLGLKLRNVKELQRIVESGQRISHADFMARFAPSAADAQDVTSYLRSQRMRKVTVSPDRLLVSGEATTAQAETAFHTRLEAFATKGGNVYANTEPALVPERFGGMVSGVLGLNDVAKMALSHAFTASPCFPVDPAPSPAPCVRGFSAQEVQIYYDAGSTPTGSLTTVAVMAEGNVTQAVSDLRFSEQQNGLSQVPVSIVTVGLPSSDTSGLDEWDLDSQSSTGIAGTVKHLYFYATTSLTDSDVANEYDRWVTDDLAQLGNSSFGECEYSAYLDGAMAVDDNVLIEGAAQGQTMFASTGDNGSACAVVAANGAPASGLPMVNYPASSPYVVGVGGTTALSNNDDTYLGESAWNAGGGGVSQFENSPRYMQKVQIVGGTVAEANLRGLPDVAMAGDPNSGGFEVWANPQIQTATGPCGNPCQIGGTSESSPLSMGVYARLQSAHNNALGFASPQLYNIYIEHPSATSTLTGPPPTQVVAGYHDAITGSNGAYAAAPGYDYTNGMGSFDISLTNGFIGH
ncbi:MAG: S8/S53 family peptidase [Candidatus Eremiobacteraeota bacterium]|nr:S8/S53 family peptidase [Candidatus Eremiobacteraeota bacterium]MBV8375027.1 S8/S53 family peptidase [Candidatus Eremiobacteraeota bacterium]